MKNAIVGFSTNHSYESLNVFIRSAREVYGKDECDIIIFTNSYESWYRQFDSLDVQFVPTISLYDGRRRLFISFATKLIIKLTNFFKSLSNIGSFYNNSLVNLCESFLHPHIIRWSSYERFLNIRRNYRLILLSDVRDVVFQSDFFDYITDDDKVFFADQSIHYGDKGCDSDWYRSAWGRQALDEATGKPCLCIGTILGSHAAILDFTRQINKYFLSDPYRGVEQAIFNYLLINKIISIEYEILANVEGPIATLANPVFVTGSIVVEEKICRKKDMSVIPVVHMYDRYEEANQLISKKYE